MKKIPMKPPGIEQATFRCATVVPSTVKYTVLYYTALHFSTLLRHHREASSHYVLSYVSMCITNTAVTFLCNLAGTDSELPEEHAISSEHVGAV